MRGTPPWAKHWPLGRDPKCPVCDERDPWKLHYYMNGFRCEEHRPRKEEA